MRRVVITGATGVIGMALIKKCIETQVEVVALVNPASSRLSRIPDDHQVTVIKCGLSDLATADADSLGLSPLSPEDATTDGNRDETGFADDDVSGSRPIFADAMFHLAWGGTFGDARNDKKLQDANACYALDAVRLAGRLGCRVFVGAGSQAEYGRVTGKLTPDTPCNPENEYGRAKLRASAETRDLAHKLAIRHIWPRVLSIYGPYDGDDTMIMSLIGTLLKEGTPLLTAGEQMWDYLYADDAASAFMLLAEKGRDGGIYPIGSGHARPLRKYIETIRDEIDPALSLGFGQVPYSDRQVMYLCADISKLTEDTGFVPDIDFSEGARRTIEYVKGK